MVATPDLGSGAERRGGSSPFIRTVAKIAQLVEHNLAKVGVAGSNPVFRSIPCPGGGTGRHAGLKILCLLWRAGSSPAWGTFVCKATFYRSLFLCSFLIFLLLNN